MVARLAAWKLQVWFSSQSDRSAHTVGHTKQYIKVLVDRWLSQDAFPRFADSSNSGAGADRVESWSVRAETNRFWAAFAGWKSPRLRSGTV